MQTETDKLRTPRRRAERRARRRVLAWTAFVAAASTTASVRADAADAHRTAPTAPLGASPQIVTPTHRLVDAISVSFLSLAAGLLGVHALRVRKRAGRWKKEVDLQATYRARAEGALRDSEAFNRIVLDSMPAHVAVFDADGKITQVNAAWCRFAEANGATGDPAAWIGVNYMDVCRRAAEASVPGARECYEALEGLRHSGGRQVSIEYECHSPDRPRWFLLQAAALRHERAGVLVTHIDVTDRKIAGQRLAESERWFRAVCESAQDAIVIVDHGGRITYANVAMERILGFTARELVGRSVHEMLALPEHRDRADRGVDLFAHTGQGDAVGRTLEVLALRKFGTPIPAELSVSSVEIAGQRHAIGIIRDVSVRKQMEIELRDAHAQLKSVVDAATQVSIIATDPTGVITLFNSGAERMLGYRAGEMVGRHTPAVIHLEAEVRDRGVELSRRYGTLIEGFEAFVAEARRGGYDEREWTYIRRDGTHIIVNLAVTAVRDKAGQITGFLGVAQDVTDRKKAERDLQTAKRMVEAVNLDLLHANSRLREAIDHASDMAEAAEQANRAKSEFLANMSHELRTPLHGILSFASFGLRKYTTAAPEKLRDYFERIHQSGTALLDLLNDLLDLAKHEAGKMKYEFETADLAIQVSSVLDEFATHAAERQVTIEWTPPPEPRQVWMDRVRIGQVVRNIVSNAVKFSPAGGVITVTLDSSADVVRLTVVDQGPGIPSGELELVFDKFVQSSKTKSGAGGTGLGLSICREIVAAHGGRIWADNHSDGGAVFAFEIPRQPRSATCAPGGGSPGAVERGGAESRGPGAARDAISMAGVSP